MLWEHKTQVRFLHWRPNKETMLKYKDTHTKRGSALYEAMQDKNKKVAEKVYKATTARYNAMYSQEDRDWFKNHYQSWAYTPVQHQNN